MKVIIADREVLFVREMKDSGVAWIERIPSCWDTVQYSVANHDSASAQADAKYCLCYNPESFQSFRPAFFSCLFLYILSSESFR